MAVAGAVAVCECGCGDAGYVRGHKYIWGLVCTFVVWVRGIYIISITKGAGRRSTRRHPEISKKNAQNTPFLATPSRGDLYFCLKSVLLAGSS